MYIRDNSTYIFKLGDFGIARGIPGPGIPVTMIGARGFAAPEVERGMPCNQKADMYGLGKCMEFIHNGTPASGLWWQLCTNLTDLEPCGRQTAEEVYRSILRHLEQGGNHKHHGHSIRPLPQQPSVSAAPLRFGMQPHPTPPLFGMQSHPTPQFYMQPHPMPPPIQTPLLVQPPFSILCAPTSNATAISPLSLQSITTGNVGGPRPVMSITASVLSPQYITASFQTARGSLNPSEATRRRWIGQ